MIETDGPYMAVPPVAAKSGGLYGRSAYANLRAVTAFDEVCCISEVQLDNQPHQVFQKGCPLNYR